jgi:hypothetical protein
MSEDPLIRCLPNPRKSVIRCMISIQDDTMRRYDRIGSWELSKHQNGLPRRLPERRRASISLGAASSKQSHCFGPGLMSLTCLRSVVDLLIVREGPLMAMSVRENNSNHSDRSGSSYEALATSYSRILYRADESLRTDRIEWRSLQTSQVFSLRLWHP